MPLEDDLRRLSELDSIYLGQRLICIEYPGSPGFSVTSWYKGRLQQANDGNWIFRSISSDGTVVGFQLGPTNQNWGSSETPSTGITVTMPITSFLPPSPQLGASLFLQQQVPPEFTN
jgi:hypothetical protein